MSEDASKRLTKQFIYLFGYFILAIPIGVLLLEAVLGPTDYGIRCVRSQSQRQCEILQTRFGGIAFNSSFAIPENTIHGARGYCKTGGMGRGRSVSCNVYLLYGSEQEYPVLSYQFFNTAQMEKTANKLNEYFNDKTMSSIEFTEGNWLLNAYAYFLMLILGCGVLFLIVWLCNRKRLGADT